MKPYTVPRYQEDCATLDTHRVTIAVNTPVQYYILSISLVMMPFHRTTIFPLANSQVMFEGTFLFRGCSKVIFFKECLKVICFLFERDFRYILDTINYTEVNPNN